MPTITSAATRSPPRIAHGWSVWNSHEPRTVIARKTATSKQQKSMNTPNSTCRARSARASRLAAATPKTRKTSPWTAVYFRTMPGAIVSVAVSRRPSKSAAPSKAGVRNGVAAARSYRKNQMATAAAPASPTRIPSYSILSRPMAVAPLLPGLLHLFPAVLRSFGHRLANPLARFFDAFPDLALGNLLRAPFDLTRPGLHLRVIGSEGESGCEQREREHAHDDQSEPPHHAFHLAAPSVRRRATSCLMAPEIQCRLGSLGGASSRAPLMAGRVRGSVTGSI